MNISIYMSVSWKRALLSMALIGVPMTPQLSRGQDVRALPISYWAHLPMIDVYLNGQGPFSFVVDTGAGRTVLDESLVSRLELTASGKARIGSPMGTEAIETPTYPIDSARIGDVDVGPLTILSMDLSRMFGAEDPPRGILSAAGFEGLLLTIDTPNDLVYVREGELPESDGKQILEYTVGEGEMAGVVPHVSVSLGDQELLVALDTGAPSSILVHESYIPKLQLVAAPQISGTGRTVDKTFDVRTALLDGRLLIGDIEIENPRVAFTASTTQAVIGMDILGQFALTIDRSNRRLKLALGASAAVADSDGSAQAEPSRRLVSGASGKKRYGIMFAGIAGDVLDVKGVTPDDAAAKAGLKVGDRILEINGHPLSSLSQADRMRMLRASPLVVKVRRGNETVEITMSLD